MLAWLYKYLQGFVAWIGSLVDYAWDATIQTYDVFMRWLEYLPCKSLGTMLNEIAAFVVSIPRPALYDTAQSHICTGINSLSGMTMDVDFMGPLGLIFGAYGLRFVIRRLPFIG